MRSNKIPQNFPENILLLQSGEWETASSPRCRDASPDSDEVSSWKVVAVSLGSPRLVRSVSEKKCPEASAPHQQQLELCCLQVLLWEDAKNKNQILEDTTN